MAFEMTGQSFGEFYLKLQSARNFDNTSPITEDHICQIVGTFASAYRYLDDIGIIRQAATLSSIYFAELQVSD